MAVRILLVSVARTLLYGCQNTPRARARYKSIVHHKTSNLTLEKALHKQSQLSHVTTSSHQQEEPPFCFSSSDALLVGMVSCCMTIPCSSHAKRNPRWKQSRLSCRYWFKEMTRRTSVAHKATSDAESEDYASGGEL